MTRQTPSAPGQDFDVVVVGGGAAGLAGAVALGRSRRSVLVLDAGTPRNATAGHVHNYLGRESTPPAELTAIGREEAARYGVEVAAARVSDVRPWDGAGTGFVVRLDDGRETTARRLLVATGSTDVLPEVPGLAERWGRDVLHCPYCHGWEVQDQSIVVLATNVMAAHQASLFRQLSDDVVVVLAEGAPQPGDDEVEQLVARGIRVLADAPTEVLVADDAIRGLRLASGAELDCRAVVVSPRFEANAAFLAPLGLAPEPFQLGEDVLGTRVPTTESHGATTVPGLWVAGNVTDPMAQVVASAAAGLRAGAMINADLIGEETREAVAAHRARLFEQPAWEERYAGESIWSGRVNPQLETEAATLAPGRALDIGCGEGADAVWLAAHGWSVTGVDFSTTGLARAAEHAGAAGVADRIEWRHLDVRSFDPGPERWDLVTSQFMHLPDGAMVDLTRRLGRAVAPGGTLLVVGHHPDDHATGLRHGGHGFLFTPEDLLPALDPAEWEVEVTDVRPRAATGHDGEQVTVRDSVLRARRR
ncbi:bifunctional NAD(P)/FAD-dependent oxidoreductase/class I SAM-dependent methyltransferase [Nocardioides sp. 616]|uniref:bifunctional NAD(P)/FAD-dependent oxidoreductase/class I SAM-dependent methyltransferase n=1 Tax=Nocardioides sp. 616 TaxID=2268090 RepID=UPI000CE348FE|nr:bifunctional NAD(P)/FAD-dependent oxidoreductase/class I SAM-dependent methyltransferase [Nocardioides sp. 616]